MLNALNDYEAFVDQKSKEEQVRLGLLARLPKGWTGKEIMTTDFPPPRWAVVDLIPTGAILLSGVFKSGKSWMMLQLADVVSRGRPFLGHATNQGTVLYLALEDGPARIQRRASMMGITLAENVHIYTSWTPGPDALAALDAWIKETPVRLVIIDTLSRWPDENHDSDVWRRDTSRIAGLKTIADRYDCSILIVHHRSKASREDLHQSVAGTNALQGAADGSLVLDRKRGEDTAKLAILGRDIPEGEVALEFSQESCTWEALDIDPAEIGLTPEGREIMEKLRRFGGRAHTHEIAIAIGKKDDNTSHQLENLESRGLIAKSGYGEWSVKNTVQSVQSIQSESETLNTLNASLNRNVLRDKELL